MNGALWLLHVNARDDSPGNQGLENAALLGDAVLAHGPVLIGEAG